MIPNRRSHARWWYLVLLGAVMAAGCAEGIIDAIDSSVSTTMVSDSLSFERADRIDVDTAAGSIEIVASTAQTVSVTRTFRYSGDEAPDTTAELRGGTLELTHSCSGFDRCSIEYLVETPATVDLKLDSASGSISVTGITGAVEADAASGSITLTDVTGTITADSASGSVTGTGLVSSTVTADTASGSIRLTFADAPDSVRANAASGSVRVFVPGGPYDVDAKSTSGSVSVNIATDPAASQKIVAKSTSGSVEVGPA